MEWSHGSTPVFSVGWVTMGGLCCWQTWRGQWLGCCSRTRCRTYVFTDHTHTDISIASLIHVKFSNNLLFKETSINITDLLASTSRPWGRQWPLSRLSRSEWLCFSSVIRVGCLCVQNYKSLCPAVVMSDTLINRHTHTKQTTFEQLMCGMFSKF